MHIWCVDGSVGKEVRGLMDALKRAGTALAIVAALTAYLERWRWPRQRACGAERVNEGKSFSATESQTLG